MPAVAKDKKRRPFRKLKRVLVVSVMLLLVLWGYVEIVNVNSKNMTIRQKIMKALYPAIMFFNTKKNDMVSAPVNKPTPAIPFYSLSMTANNQQPFDFAQLKGKKVLLVNTASDCGYTPQYDDLQKLYERNSDKLVVIGFPANDFKEQEKGDDAKIAEFCKINFGVTFPLMTKSGVIKNAEQNPVFQWLTDSKKNGWNNKEPEWNFSKYLVDENGVLLHYFPPAVAPLGEEILKAIGN